MRRLLEIVLMLLLFIPIIGFSQNLVSENKKQKVDEILLSRGEAFLAIPASQRKAFIPLINLITPDKLTDSLLYFYVNKDQFRQILASGLDFQVLKAPSMLAPVRMATGFDEILSGQAYPTYQQYLDLMKKFHADYPTVCTIDTIGYSIKGRLILAARLQSGNYKEGARPVVFYSSSMHGDEVVGYSLMLMLINDFLTNLQGPNRFSEILSDVVLIVNPLSNPDGTYFQNDSSIYGATRYNSNSIDLNRNYPDVLKGMNYLLADVQPENKAMVHYMEKFHPSLSANFHTGAEVVNYPWDSWHYDEYIHADDNWFIEICKEYVDTARIVDPTYLRTISAGYVFGSDWYWIPRGRQDFVTYCLRGRELTIELSNDKLPDASQIPGFWFKNHSALINLINRARYGVYGTITDSITNNAVEARVEIPGYDKNESFVFSSPVSGNFFRFLPEGNYNLNINSTGYRQKTINVNVSKNQRTTAEIKLVPIGLGIIVRPVPGIEGLNIGIYGDDSRRFLVELFDLSGRKVREKIFSGNSGIIDGVSKLGIYILRVRSDSQTASQLVFINKP